MKAESIIEREIGINIGAKDLTPMDYGECKRCMNAFAIHVLEEAQIYVEKLCIEDDNFSICSASKINDVFDKKIEELKK